jgi:hypothetical protein
MYIYIYIMFLFCSLVLRHEHLLCFLFTSKPSSLLAFNRASVFLIMVVLWVTLLCRLHGATAQKTVIFTLSRI